MKASKIAGGWRPCTTAALLLTTGFLTAATCRAQTAPPVLPQNGTVKVGNATIISPNASTLNINQATSNAVIHWQNFSVGPNGIVNFNQPNAASSTLNRVTGATPSSVAGTINAPGTVLLVNPNGIAFTRDAKINVGSVTASSLNISDEDYLAGKLRFQGNGASAAVSNAGLIQAADGGFVALIGGSVSNTGTINANLGKVGLGAGEYVTIDPTGDGFLQVAIPSADADKLLDADGKPIKALINQAGAINAAGGTVAISAAAARTAAVDAVNMSGTVRARSVSQRNGSITLSAGDGTTMISGTLDASGVNDGEKGGSVVALGKNVGLVADAKVDASGAAGGGKVELGGSARGAGPLPNASGFYMDKNASIDASATKNGNGGNVVTWGTDSNRTWGTIAARGAGAFSKGGLVETSGHWLDVDGARVSLRGGDGTAGEWLLDPTDITISISFTSNGSLLSGLFTPVVGALTSILNITDLTNALNSAGTVTISSASTGASTGTLTLNNGIFYNSNNAATLNLISDSTMNLNSAISSIGNGVLNLNLTSGGALNIGLLGGLTLGGNSAPTVNLTSAGAMTFNAGISASTPGLNLTLNSGGLLTTNSLAPISYTGNSPGSITLNGAGGISLFNNISSSNSRLNISGVAGNSTVGGVIQLNNGITLNANGGNILLSNTLLPANVDVHGIYLGNVSLLTSGTGSINLIGNGAGTAYGGISLTGLSTVLTAGSGGISLLGSSDYNSGISFGIGAFSSSSLTSTGNISIEGHQTNSVLNGGQPVGSNGAVGFYGTANINATGALNIIGTSEQGIAAPGIAFLSTPTVSLRGSSVTLTGTNNSSGVSGDATRTGAGLRIDTPITLIANSGDITLTGISKSSYGAGINIAGANTYTLAAGRGLFINGTNTAALTNTAVNIAAAINVAARPLSITGTGLTSITAPLTAANVSIGQGFTGFTPTSNAITLGSTITASGSLGVTSSSGNILSSSTFTSGTGQYSFATLGGGGNITFNNAVSYTGASAGSFSALADGILSNRSIGSTVAAMDITLAALNTASASASGLLLAGTSLSANGGNITLTGVGRGAGLANDASAGAGLGLSGTSSILTSGSGRISIDARNNGGSANPAALYATGTSTITAGTGGINILGVGGTGSAILLGQQSGDTTSITSTGAITLNGSTSATASGTAGVVLGRGVGITGSGAVTISGTATGAGSQGGVVQSNPGTQTIRGASISITGNTSGNGVGVGLTGTTSLTADTGSITLDGTTTSSANAAVNLGGTLSTTLTAGVTAALNLFGSNSGNSCVVGTPAINAGTAAINITGNGTHTLNALTGGAITIAASGTGLTNATSAITLNGDINATGAVSAISQSGRVNVNGNITTTATGNSAVILAAGAAATAPVALNTDARGNVILASGKTITTGASGRVVVYTGSIANTTGFGTLAASGSGRFRYGRVYGDTSLLSGGSGVYLQYREQPVLTLTLASSSRTYDSTTLNNSTYSTTLATYGAITGFQNGDTSATSGNTLTGSLAFNGSVNTAVRNAGTYTLGAGTLASGLGYAFDIASGVPSLTISPRSVNLTASVDSRQYNGTTSSSAAPVLSALLGTDSSSGVGVQVFSNKNAGTGKAILPSVGSLLISDGNGGNNYLLNAVNASGTITAAPLTVTASAGVPKTYDGTTASIATPLVTGLFGSDSVTGAGVQVFTDKNVGTAKVQTPSVGSLLVSDGNGGNNYLMQFVQNTAGVIVQAAATLRANVSSKLYDGSASSSVTPSLIGAVGADVVSGTGSQTYDSKNVGAGIKVVTPSIGTLKFLDGSGVDVTSNYAITKLNNTVSTITPATLTLTASAAVPKVYNGGLDSSGVPVVSGLIGSDSVTGQGLQVFTDKNVGTGKTITASVGSLQINDGNSGGNYLMSLVNSAAGVITPASITVSAVTDHKTYDGTNTSSLLPQITIGALQGSDSFTARAQVFANKNAGTGKTLTPSVTINDGNGGNNYSVTLANNITGIIDARALHVVPGIGSKVYDGTTASVVVPNVVGLQTGDSLTGAAIQVYNDRNVGTSKTLSAALGTLAITDGNSGNNYNLVLDTADIGTITARPITVTAAAGSKTYDGGMVSAATPLITAGALQTGDNATLTQVYTTKNTGTGLTLVPSAVISDGNGGNNYTVTRVNSSNGTINKTNIEITASTNTRQYDGTVAAVTLPTVTSGSLQGTDGFSTLLQQYAGKNVGTSLTLIPQATINDGNSGNNYNISLVNSTGGIITARPIVVSAVADIKAYDRTTSSSVIPLVTTGSLISGDTNGFTQAFDNGNIGIGKTLTPSGVVNDGNGGANYAVTFHAGAIGTITQRPITVTAQTNTKTYDGTTSASATPGITLGSLLSGDTASFSQLYQSRNAGTGLTLIPSGTVNDGNGGQNYLVTFVNSANGTINARALTLTAAADSKTYDGGLASAATPLFTVGALQTGDTATLSQAYLTKNVGTGLTLAPTVVINDGNGGNNYVLSRVNSSNGTITRANIEITASTNTRQYDGTVAAVALPTITSGALQGTDGFSTLAQQYTSKNVGTGLTLNPSAVINDGNSGNNYIVSLVSSTGGTITARPIVVSAAADIKAYDRTTSSSVIPVLTSGSLISGDTNAFTQVFDNGNIGTGKTLTPSGVVSDGNGGNNYAVTFLPGTIGAITQRPITVTAQTNTKTYDGTTSASATPGITLGSLLSGDTASFTQLYQSRNAGTGLTLIPSGAVNDGNGGQNYLVTFVNSANGTINARALTLTAAADSKTYDGGLASVATPLITVGALQTGDTATLSQAYLTKNVGSGLTLAPNLVISDGNGGNNYSVTRVNSSNGTINRANIEITASTNTRQYDGTLNAANLPTITSGALLGTDGFSTLAQQYTGKNVGTGLTLNPSAVINDGNSGNNYNVSLVGSTGGIITARPITVTAAADTKAYDRTTSSSVIPLLTSGSLISGDTNAFTQVFDNGNIGVGKTLTPSGVVNDGNSGANYAVTFLTSTTGTITQRPITVTAQTNTKTYDGTTSASATPGITLGSLLSGDTASFSQLYQSRNAGTGLTLIPSGTVNDGNGGQNYLVTFVNSANGTINARALTLTAATDSKIYDGGLASAATPLITVGALQTGDSATLSQTYLSKNVGSGLTLVPTLVISDGNGGNNYSVTRVNSSNGTINRANLEITASTNSRQYDGTLDAANLPTITQGSLLGTDGFASFAQQYTGKNVGTGLTLNPLAVISDGNSGNNYNVSLVASTGGIITARPIVVTAAADTKAYDRVTSSAVIPLLTSGSLVSGDTNAFTQVFDNGNIGVGKTLTPSGVVNDGNGGANYAVTFLTSTAGTITQRPITVTAQTNTKTYDGTTSASATPGITLGSLLSGDTASFSQLYQSRNAGTGLTLIPSGTINDGNGGQNYLVTFVNSANGTINARALTLTAAADTKSYDGVLNSSATPLFTVGALQTGDSATLTQAFLSKNAGTGLTLVPDAVINDGNAGNNYVLSRVNSSNGTITKANIQITATTNSRQYDGSVNAASLPTISSGALQGTDGFSTLLQQYSSRNAGTGLTLNPLATINDGNSGNNYNVSLVSSTGGIITARPITVAAVTDTKAYDRTTTSSLIPTLTAGSLVSGDTNAFTQAFDNGNIGTGKTLIAGGIVSDGNGGANYAVTFLNSLSGVITQRPITVTAQTNTKTYDGTTSATAIPGITQGSLLSGDTASFSQNYVSRNAGVGLTLIPTGAVTDGNGGQNYLVTFINSANGTINARPLTLTAAADTKSYDGSISSTATPLITVGALQTGDSATLSQTYLSRNAGTGLTLVPDVVINDGNSGNNYVLSRVNSSNGTITKADIQITATTNSRQYDGTVNATSLPTISSGALQGTDGFSAFAQQYAGKNVGTGLTLNPLAVINDGNSGNNYNVSLVSSSGGTITARPIVVSAAADTKAYDRTTSSSVTPVLTSGSLVSGDSGTFTQLFDTANIGTAKTLTPSGVVSDGNGGGNYAMTFVASSTGTITQRPITVTAQTNTKTYDGTTGAAAIPGITQGSLLSGDTASFSQSYQSKNAGVGLTLIPTGIVSDSNGGQNYLVTFVNSANGIINPLDVTINAAAASKQYDGNALSSVAPLLPTLLGSDSFSGSGVQTYVDKNAGTGKTLTPTLGSLVISDGNGGNNYHLNFQSASLGDITRAPLTVTATANSRTYNGATDASAVPVISGGSLKGTDTFSALTESYASKNAGTGLTLIPTAAISDGNGGNNYVLTLVNNLSGVIDKATATLVANPVSKQYDGTTASIVTPTFAGLLSGDTSTGTGSQVFSDKNAGINKVMTPTQGTLSINDGNSGNNYNIVVSSTAVGTITQAPIQITSASNTKTYDGTTSAAATPTVTGGTLKTGDTFASISQTYATDDAGTGITLTPSVTISDSNGGNNYLVTLVNSNSGIINRAPITITASTDRKTYDGTTTSALTPQITSGSLFGSDGFTTLTQSFSNDNAGTGKTLVPVVAINDGNNGNNYTITAANNLTGIIDPRPVTVSGSRTYNGLSDTSAAANVLSVNNLISGDAVTLSSGAGVIAGGGAGVQSLVSMGTLALSGADAPNYTLLGGGGLLTINPLAINVALNGTRTYDDTTAVSSSLLAIANNLDGANLALAGTGTLGSVNAGVQTLTSTAGALSGLSLTGAAASNYTTTGGSGTVTVTPRAITVTAQSGSKIYDGTTASAVTPQVTGGNLVGDDSNGFGQIYSSRNVGSGLTLTPSGIVNDGNGGANYLVTFANNAAGVITPRSLTVAPSSYAKVYDGTTVAGGTPVLASGTIATGDTANFTQVFNSKNAGTGLAMTVSGGVADGNGGANYSLQFTSLNSGTITQRPILVAAQTNTKTYDGTTSAAVTPSVTTGSIAFGDTAAFTEAYLSKNAGTNLTLTPSGIVNDGNNGANYSVQFVNASSGIISPLAINLAAQSGSKQYDGTVNSSVAPVLDALLGGDTTSGVATQRYSDTNAGTGKTLIASLGNLVINDGNGGHNYTIVALNATAGEITRAPITVTASGNTKTYDGTTTSALLPSITAGTLFGVDNFATLSQVYQSKNAGTGLTLTPTAVISDGNGGNNYTLTLLNNTTGVINKADVTLTAQSATKVYDTTVNTSVTPQLGQLFLGDTFSGTATQTFTTKNAGSGLTLTPQLGALVINDGNGGNNYNVVLATNANGTITAAPLTLTAAAGSKTYDGTVSSTAIPTLAGLLGSDSVTGAPAQAYTSKNAGSNLTLTPTLGTLVINDGNDGHNYTVNAVASSAGSIVPAVLVVTAAANTKTYDGTLSAAAAPAITAGALWGSDSFAANTETYANKNAGSGLTLIPSVTINDGNGGNNYVVTLVNNTGGVINKATATLVANVATKTYDGSTATAVAPSFEGLATGDTVTGFGTESFGNPNAGINKVLTPALGTLAIVDGNNGNNYDIVVSTRNNGTINPLAVQLALVGTRLYDGTTSISSSQLAITNNIDGNNLTLAGTGSLISKNAGWQPMLMTGGVLDGVTLVGTAAGNYTVVGGSGLVEVTPVPITVSVSNGNKVYDGTLAALVNPVVVSGSLKGSDSFGDLTANYATKNVGTGITITPDIEINDGNSGNNYVVSVTPGVGDITQALATLTATSQTKVYDGTTASSVGPAILGLAPGDFTTGSGSQVFNDRNAGTGKVLTPDFGTLVINDGNNGANYMLSIQNGSGTITPAPLTLTASAASKSYDGTTAASGTPELAGLIAGDTVMGSGLQAFENKNAGVSKELVPSMGSILITDGNGGNNYAVNLVSSFGGEITPAAITVAAAADAKVYDGTTQGAGTPTITEGTIFSGDVAAFTNTFASRNAGTGITLTPTGVVNDGNNGGNYIVTRLSRNDGAISPAQLTIVADAKTRAVGDDDPIFTGTVVGFVGGDTLGNAVNGSLIFTTGATSTSPAGTYEIAGSGLFSTNYTFVQASANNTALQITEQQVASEEPWRMSLDQLSSMVASYSLLRVQGLFELPLMEEISSGVMIESAQELVVSDDGVSLRATLVPQATIIEPAFEEMGSPEFDLQTVRALMKCPPRYTCSQKPLNLHGVGLGSGRLDTRTGPRVR